MTALPRRDALSRLSRLALATAAAPLLLAGCVVPLAPDEVRLRGRFAVSIQGPAGRESHTGRFELAERPGLRRLDLLTPLGGVLVRIEEAPDGARLWRRLDEEPLEGSSLDALLLRSLGFAVPVNALSEIAQAGAAAPDDTRCGEWRARILSRAADGSPQRLRFERAAGPDGSPAVSLTAFIEKEE